MNKKAIVGIVSLFLAFTLSACGASSDKANPNKSSGTKSSSEKNMNMDHMEPSTGEVPAGLKTAENPTYKVGSKVIIHANHMEGMNGAKAIVVGAYDTTAYVVSYIPTTGGEMVKNHKWVIQEEIKDAGIETLKPETEVTLEADHMEGMKGAKATIDSSEKTTVYMVDYTPTTGGEMVKNHKWVTESELSGK